MLLVGASTTILAILIDTAFYTDKDLTLDRILHHPVITPLNNLMYNSSSGNLAQHGLHPYYQHLVANLSQLLGPAYPLLFGFNYKSYRLASALCGILVLSLIPHQEPRFLLPAVPLVLSSISLPRRYTRTWVVVWVVFNALLGTLMGKYHQGGVVPAQMHLARTEDLTHSVWWKTYGPPTWLLGARNTDVVSKNLMGVSGESMLEELRSIHACPAASSSASDPERETGVYLVAPLSATFLDRYIGNHTESDVVLEEAWRCKSHINLDDLDFGDDGVWSTLKRVVGRRGIGVWKVKRRCGRA